MRTGFFSGGSFDVNRNWLGECSEGDYRGYNWYFSDGILKKTSLFHTCPQKPLRTFLSTEDTFIVDMGVMVVRKWVWFRVGIRWDRGAATGPF